MAKVKTRQDAPLVRLLKTTKGRREFWEIVREGTAVITRTGPLHSTAKPKRLSYKTPEKAHAKYEELIAQQRVAGFRALGEIDAPRVPIARDAGLEAEIREHRDDPAPYLVYADWLQGQGSPLGELIVLAQRGKQKEASAIARKIGVPPADMVKLGWRHGLWQWVHLNNTVDHMADKWDPLPMVRAVFASPLCVALEELRLGMLRWDFQDDPAVIAEAGRHAWARDLPRLAVGLVDGDIDMAHHAIGDVGKTITKSFPNLVSLTLRSGSQDWRGGKETFGFGGLELPRLRSLAIETCAMTGKRIKMLASARLPALETLEVWFGDRDHEPIAKVEQVAPIWDGGLFPKLRHLGIKNTEMVSDVIRLLPASKLARQLETLDLSMGTMDDGDARALAAQASRFPRLGRLVLAKSFVTPAAVKQVKAAFPQVEVSAKHPKERYDWDPEHRYVSVAE
jgi:uncharacterized protein (TIGR02996 family)